MNKTLVKQKIFWEPAETTVANIDDSDTCHEIEAARHRLNACLRDLETAFDAKACELRAAFLAEVTARIGGEA